MVVLILLLSALNAWSMDVNSKVIAPPLIKTKVLNISEKGILIIPEYPVLIEAEELILNGSIKGGFSTRSQSLTFNNKKYECLYSDTKGGNGASLGRFKGGLQSHGFGGAGASNFLDGANALFFISGSSFLNPGVSYGKDGVNGSGGGRGFHGGLLILDVKKISGQGHIDLSGTNGGTGGASYSENFIDSENCGIKRECLEHKSKEGCVKFIESTRYCDVEKKIYLSEGGGGAGGDGGCLYSKVKINNYKINGGLGGKGFFPGQSGKTGVIYDLD